MPVSDSELTSRFNQAMNKMMNKMIQSNPDLAAVFGGRGSRFLYYSPKNPINASRKCDQYFYTPHKTRQGGKLGFLSGIYRFNASKKQWKAIRVVRHRRRKDADARAYRLREQNA